MYGGRQQGQEWLGLLTVRVLTVVLTVVLLYDRFKHSKCMVDGSWVRNGSVC